MTASRWSVSYHLPPHLAQLRTAFLGSGMPDVGTCTSPRLLKRHAELFGTRKSTTPPSISMLGLPLELVTQILDATMVHPEEEQAAREQLEDPWSHGWRSPVKASTLAT